MLITILNVLIITKKLIGDKAIIGVADEIYDMNGEGTFTATDGTVRPSTGVASVLVDRRGNDGDGDDDVGGGGNVVSSTTCATRDSILGGGKSGGRGVGRGGRKVHMVSLMVMQMKDKRD